MLRVKIISSTISQKKCRQLQKLYKIAKLVYLKLNQNRRIRLFVLNKCCREYKTTSRKLKKQFIECIFIEIN